MADRFFALQGKKRRNPCRIPRMFNAVKAENSPPRPARGDSKRALSRERIYTFLLQEKRVNLFLASAAGTGSIQEAPPPSAAAEKSTSLKKRSTAFFHRMNPWVHPACLKKNPLSGPLRRYRRRLPKNSFFGSLRRYRRSGPLKGFFFRQAG